MKTLIRDLKIISIAVIFIGCASGNVFAGSSSYSSSVVTQGPTTAVSQGNTLQQILQIAVTGSNSAGGGTYCITQMVFTTQNTNNADVAAAKLYYNGTTGTLADGTAGTTLLATIANPSGTMTFTFNQSLSGNSTYYFYLVYDISASATVCTNTVDALMTSLTHNSVNCTAGNVTITTMTTPNPAGSRTIQGSGCWNFCTPTSTGSGFPINNVTFSNINNSVSNPTIVYEDFYSSVFPASVRRTQSYTISVSATGQAGAAFYGNVFFDWNDNGIFDPTEEYDMGTSTLASITYTMSITIPATATIGTVRMRVMHKYASYSIACFTGGNNLQVEDYAVNILPAPVNMVYSSTTITQITDTVLAGSTQNQILMLDVFTTGQLSAPSATQFVFKTTGTTNITDITNARLYSTGSSSTFATTTQIGATIAVPPASPTTMTFTTSAVLAEGDNYFWIAYDVIAAAPTPTTPGFADAELTSVTVGGTAYPQATGNPTGSRPIKPSPNMYYVSSAVVQNTNPVAIGTANNDVISVQVVTYGALSPINATSLTFRTNGTTNTGDILNAKVYFTGTSSTFSTATQFGTTLATPPAVGTNFTFNGTATLSQGTNYFWLTYDVSPSAACNPAQIDGLCNNVVVAGVSHTPVPSAPSGARTINCGVPYYSQGSLLMNNLSSWNSQRNGSGSAPASFASGSDFYVQNGHSMTTNAAFTLPNLYVETGGYVTASSLITMTNLFIATGATYEQTAAAPTTNTTYITNFYINIGGTWKHNNSGALPGLNRYFQPYSIQWFLGIGAGTFPSGTNWGTVYIDLPTAQNLIINNLSISYIHGDLEWRRWGVGNYFYLNMDNPVVVDGNMYIKGGICKGVAGYNCGVFCNCNATASAINVQVAGDLIVSGGEWNDYFCGANGSTGMSMKIGGNVSITGGIFKMTNNTTATGSTLRLQPVLPSSTWKQTGGTITLGNTFIESGKTVTLTGNKMGDFASTRALTIETGGALYCSNYPVTGAGLFTMQTGTTLGIGSAAGITASGATGNIQVSGTRTYHSGSTYEYYEGLTQVTGNFTTTTTSGTYPAQVTNLIMNKTSASTVVTLTNTTDVTGTLTLTKGILTASYNAATAPWVRIPTDVASVSPAGGSANSYVDGYIRKTGSGAFTFPTGNGGYWRRIGMTAPSAATEFEARYVASPYANTSTFAVSTPAIDHVSLVEHWFLSKPLGATASTTKVNLFWEDASYSGIYKFDSLLVVRWSGTSWENTNCYTGCPGNWLSSCAQRTYTGSASGSGAGTLQSNTVSNFSPFTFGSLGLQALNPLPIELLNFTGTCNGEVAVLNWTTASETNNEYFTLEKSTDAVSFIEVEKVAGAGNSTSTKKYSYIDKNPFEGTSYYRLSQTDYNGDSKTFNVISLKCTSSVSNVSAYNNQQGNVVINIQSDVSDNYNVTLVDVLGQKIKIKDFFFEKGISNNKLDISELKAGIYFVTIENSKSTTTQKIFVK